MTDHAQELRDAANTLRETAAEATPGPWQHTHSTLCRNEIEAHDGMNTPIASTWAADGAPGDDNAREEGNAAWIALVDPSLGPVLADWLEAAAHTWDWMQRQNATDPSNDGKTRVMPNETDTAALAVARVVNGGGK